MDSNLQTVGGPVDVAFISKGDGFIWRQRKLYFERNLNGDYFDRRASLLRTREGHDGKGNEKKSIPLNLLVKRVISETSEHGAPSDDQFVRDFTGSEYAEELLRDLREEHFKRVPAESDSA